MEVYYDDVVVTHTKGNIVQYNEYYPFGLQTQRSWTRENTTGNQFLFNAGSELNNVTQTYKTFFRDYDPTLGRFMQVDPLTFSAPGWNPYHYSYNNPINLNDPLGLESSITWDQLWGIIDYMWNNGGGVWTSNEYIQVMDGGSGGNAPCPGCTIFGKDPGFESMYHGEGNYSLYFTTSTSEFSNYGNMRGYAQTTVVEVNTWSKKASYSGWDFGEGLLDGNEIKDIDKFPYDFVGNIEKVAGSIIGIGKEGFTITLDQIDDSKYWLQYTKNTTKTITNSLKTAGNLGILIGTGISFVEAVQNPSQYSAWAKFGTNLVISASGLIPYVGLPLAIGLSAYEAGGGFNKFYQSFDNQATRVLYLQGMVFNDPFMFTDNTLK